MVPVRDELEVLLEIGVVSIDSSDVTAMFVQTEADVVPSSCKTELTEDAVVFRFFFACSESGGSFIRRAHRYPRGFLHLQCHKNFISCGLKKIR